MFAYTSKTPLGDFTQGIGFCGIGLLSLIAQILEEHGFVSRVAYGGREAIRQVLEDCPDTILADVLMPHVNGIETAKAIHEMCPDARILLFSGQAVTDDLLKPALAQGYSFELLPKPIEPDVLVGKLRESSSDESSSLLPS